MAKRRRKSEPGLVEVSLGIFILAWFSLYFIPQTKHLVQTTTGIVVTGLATFALWLVLMLAIWFVTKRRRAVLNEVDLTFDEPDDTGSIDRPLVTPPSDPPIATPTDFEHEVAMILNTLTPYKAIQVGGAGDGGVDIKVYQGERLIGIVQCKRYGSGVALSPGAVRELFAVKVQFGVKTAYLVTTAKFTPATRKEAKKLGIKLIDGEQLEQIRQQARERQRLQV